LPTLVIFGLPIGKKRNSIETRKPIGRQKILKPALAFSLPALCALAFLLNSCGGGGSNGGGSGGSGGSGSGGQVQGTQPGTYTITVTGTSGTVSIQSAPATLIVKAP
jgi:hypothetical protein